jgi:hypothetical protein
MYLSKVILLFMGNARLITRLKCNAVLNNECSEEIAEKQLVIVNKKRN